MDDLYQALGRMGGLQGSQAYYETDQLKELIDQVKQDKLPLHYITSSGGLRKKVAELLGKPLY